MAKKKKAKPKARTVPTEAKVEMPKEVVQMGTNEPTSRIELVSKVQKRNTFMPDAHRDERDLAILRAEIGNRRYKGKIKTITTVKQMDVDKDGFWITEFTIELKG